MANRQDCTIRAYQLTNGDCSRLEASSLSALHQQGRLAACFQATMFEMIGL